MVLNWNVCENRLKFDQVRQYECRENTEVKTIGRHNKNSHAKSAIKSKEIVSPSKISLLNKQLIDPVADPDVTFGVGIEKIGRYLFRKEKNKTIIASDGGYGRQRKTYQIAPY